MTSSPQNRLKIILFLIFAVSGFSGLIYESIWTHYIKLILGHAAYAQTLVLSIFMGGLAIGAALMARKGRALTSPLTTYAIVELLLGLLAIAFHTVFVAAEGLLHETLIPLVGSPFLIEILRWSLAALLILPQSILLGTTFPLVGTAMIRLDQQHSGSSLGMLYFSNSIGAAIGVLVSIFFLIGFVGLPGTILTAGIINVYIAAVVWVLSRQESARATTEVSSTTATSDTSASLATTGDQSQLVSKWFLGIAALTGLASFFYEIAWIRMLSLVLGSSMQAFELMLSAFITGLALGGLWIRKRIDSIQNPAVFLGKVQVIMGLCAVATIPLYHQMFDLMAFLMQSLTSTERGYLLFNLGSHAITLLVMLPTTFMAGMTLPLITFSLLKWNQGEASIGRVYAFNTVGAIIGILLAVHIAMPLIGTRGLLISGAIIDLALGLFLIRRYLDRTQANTRLKLSCACAIAVVLAISFGTGFNSLILSSGVFRYGIPTYQQEVRVLYYQDGKTASIAVNAFPDGSRSISTNGKPDAAINPPDMDYGSDEITMIMAAALPLAVHPNAQTVANIGLGSGLTTHTLLLSHQLTRLDTIEIEPAVVEAIEHFGTSTENVLIDPRSNIVIDDARAFFSRNKTRYDVIISEPSNPWVAGVSGLFTTEFYRHINAYLNDDGILVQWLHLYENNLNLVASVFNALAPHFEDYAVYAANDSDIIIVASNGRDVSSLDAALFNNAALEQQLNRVHLLGIDDIQARLIGNKRLLQPLFDAVETPTSSDYFPVLGLYATKSRFLFQTATELAELNTADFPLIQLAYPDIIHNEARSLYFASDEAKRMARNISSLLLHSETEQLSADTLNDTRFVDMQEKVALVEGLLENCEPLTYQQQLFGNGLHTIAITTLPFIDTPEMRTYWRQLGDHACLQSWPEEIQRWTRLYASIGLRQHQRTIDLAEALVRDSIANPTRQIHFLIGATVTAYLKMGRYAEARQFANRTIKDLDGRTSFDFYLEVLFVLLDVGADRSTEDFECATGKTDHYACSFSP